MWLRGQRRWIGWLALTALICQLVLSFAHRHSVANADSARIAQGVMASCHGPDRVPCGPLQPTEHKADCIVCWAAAVGSGLSTPEILAIVGPFERSLDDPRGEITSVTGDVAVHHFRARAPPAPV